MLVHTSIMYVKKLDARMGTHGGVRNNHIRLSGDRNTCAQEGAQESEWDILMRVRHRYKCKF